MRAHHGAGALAVQVEVAAVEVFAGFLQVLAAGGIDRAGEAVLGGVGDLERVVEVLGADDGGDGAEDFLLRDAGLGVNVGEDGGGDEVTGGVVGFAAGHQPAFFAPDQQVVRDGVPRTLVDDRAHEVAGVFSVAHGQGFHARHQLL